MNKEPNWKQIANSFWYACSDGDGESVEYLLEKYTHLFKEENEQSRTKQPNPTDHLK